MGEFPYLDLSAPILPGTFPISFGDLPDWSFSLWHDGSSWHEISCATARVHLLEQFCCRRDQIYHSFRNHYI